MTADALDAMEKLLAILPDSPLDVSPSGPESRTSRRLRAVHISLSLPTALERLIKREHGNQR